MTTYPPQENLDSYGWADIPWRLPVAQLDSAEPNDSGWNGWPAERPADRPTARRSAGDGDGKLGDRPG